MSYITKEKLFTKSWIQVWSLIIIGTFIMAVGFVFFISPYKLAPGGVYGIAIIFHHMFGFPIGISGLLMDIPLTILAIRILGPKFGIKTIFGFVLLAGFITLLEFTWGYEPLVEGDALLSTIFGGVLVGLGLGLVFKSRASSGGSDILAMILAKYTKLPVGKLLIFVDAFIVLFGLLAFEDWKIPLYSWIAIFITGKMVDVVLQGVSYDKTLFIISDKHEAIRDKIINDLQRGGTFIQAKGMYNGSEKQMIFTVVNRREMAILQNFIHLEDPEAFMTVFDANEIIGNGFKSFEPPE
jgi:uncharacterized membrane-anchored protein YitT (DUF2179 family)